MTPERKKHWAVAVALIDRAKADVVVARLAVASFADEKLRLALLTAELELQEAANEMEELGSEDATT